jgi:hypothetical protein
MRKRKLLIMNIIILFLFLYSFPTPTFFATVESLPEGVSHVAALEYILNYPFANLRDLKKIQAQLKFLPISKQSTSDYFSSPEFLAEVKAFTETNVRVGEELSIVNYARSDNKALRALREEVKIPAPKGGAIVRIYTNKLVMPPPIRDLFQGDIQGFTHWRRFIAVNKARKSPEELENIISHELVHAYIFSALGADNTLPKWFTEGVALYLSNTKDQYISSNVFWGDFISRASDEYEEYRQVFRYLEHSLGRRGITRFIRQTVEQQSVTDSLPQIAGVSDYVVLRNKTMEWRTWRQNLFAGIGLGLILIIIITGSWYGYRYRLRQKSRLHKQAQTLEKMIQAWERKIAAQTRKMIEVELAEERRKIESRIMRMKQKKALTLVSLGRALVKLGAPMEAERRYAEAWEAAGASLRVIEIIQQAQDELKGWIV